MVSLCELGELPESSLWLTATQTNKSFSNNSLLDLCLLIKPFWLISCNDKNHLCNYRSEIYVSKHRISFYQLRHVVLSDQTTIIISFRTGGQLHRDRSEHLLERLRLLRFALSFVQQLGQRFELRKRQLQGHTILVAVIRVMQQILEHKDNRLKKESRP